MKNLFLIVIFAMTSLVAQEDSMRTFANAKYDIKAYLIPDTENTFVAKTGTRVKIFMTLINPGTSRFILNSEKFLSASLLVKAKEIDMPLHLEKFSQ